MVIIRYRYQLDECLDWIAENQFKRIVIQLKSEDLKHSVGIVNYLKNEHKKRYFQSTQETYGPLDIYITKTNTCCVDLIVTQHVSDVDAIIHMGKVCLSKPDIKNLQFQPPILFAFGRPIEASEIVENVEIIVREIKSIQETQTDCRMCILYDTSLIEYANKLDDVIYQKNLREYVEVANLHCLSPEWNTTPESRPRFIRKPEKGTTIFGQYILNKPLDYYNCVIFLGSRLSIQLTLQCPTKLFTINCYDNMNVEQVDVTKLLNKRMALVSRLKDEEELKIGVIITNPLPDIGYAMSTLGSYSKARKHTLYFISMIQTIDECKIGNFDLCDAFIVINSCTCSTLLESLVFNRPIITDLEFKLACGFEAEYGRVMWPGSSSHLSAEDMINKRKVSDVSLALIHTRNELLERCSQARANKWSGLEYKASVGSDEGGGGGGGCGESLNVEDGLSGIASSYASEPLKKQDVSFSDNIEQNRLTQKTVLGDSPSVVNDDLNFKNNKC